MTARIAIDRTRASTPPSLLGMERRMAYANRKYHSGLMCGGVLSGLAGVWLSGSPRRSGENKTRVRRRAVSSRKPRASLMV